MNKKIFLSIIIILAIALPTVQAAKADIDPSYIFVTGNTISNDYTWQPLTGTNYYAQTFTITEQTQISIIQLGLSRDQQPGSIYITIQTVDENQHPTGDILSSASRTTKDITQRSKGLGWYTTMIPAITLDAGVYAIVVNSPNGIVSSNNQRCINWASDATGTYSLGCRQNFDVASQSWYSELEADYMFAIFV